MGWYTAPPNSEDHQIGQETNGINHNSVAHLSSPTTPWRSQDTDLEWWVHIIPDCCQCLSKASWNHFLTPLCTPSISTCVHTPPRSEMRNNLFTVWSIALTSLRIQRWGVLFINLPMKALTFWTSPSDTEILQRRSSVASSRRMGFKFYNLISTSHGTINHFQCENYRFPAIRKPHKWSHAWSCSTTSTRRSVT